MMRRDPSLRRVLVEPGAEDCGMAARILARLDGVPVERAHGEEPPAGPEALDMDKDTLRLLAFPGEFFKPCPGTREYICCGYRILHVGTNCPMDCSYCILQAYFNQPSLRVFVNLEERLEEIFASMGAQPEKIFRVGTGEFTDSLALDPLTGWTSQLLPPFSRQRNAILELKTKTDRVEGLLRTGIRDRIVVSWSLNAPDLAAREEHGAPSIRKRLEAAHRCQREGFVLGFHFDPIILQGDWRDGYREALDLLDRHVDPRGIIWISLGCLRYMPSLKPIIRRRHPRTRILDGEFVPALDGKMRYFKPLRIEAYAWMREQLEAWGGDAGLYLCMESDEVWEKGMGWSPRDGDGLSAHLDRRVLALFDAIRC
ncbi:MAG: DNA photolyase [Deltaproteobacteria bacterium]|nr:DNA photolyase [Deltaproteobacteria bacterium]